jgi:hypothetical protein
MSSTVSSYDSGRVCSGARPVTTMTSAPASAGGTAGGSAAAGAPATRQPTIAAARAPTMTVRIAAAPPGRYWTVTLIIWTGVFGRSPGPVGVVSIFFTTSMPEVIRPNTGCFD